MEKGTNIFKVKRVLGFMLSLFELIVVFPVLLTAIAIKAESRGPAIFKQERIGKDGRVFEI